MKPIIDAVDENPGCAPIGVSFARSSGFDEDVGGQTSLFLMWKVVRIAFLYCLWLIASQQIKHLKANTMKRLSSTLSIIKLR